jgi:hypothetical protein
MNVEHMYTCLGYSTDGTPTILEFIADGPSATRRKLSVQSFVRHLTDAPIQTLSEGRLNALSQVCGENEFELILLKDSMTSFGYSLVAFPQGTNVHSCPMLDFNINGVVKGTAALMHAIATVGEYYRLRENDLDAILAAFDLANENGETSSVEFLEDMYEDLGYPTNDAIMNFMLGEPSPTRHRVLGGSIVRYFI